MLQNLIGNATKFVADGVPPRVEIAAEVRDETVTVYITDNGLGIPSEARARVFGIFERFHPEKPGTGIGLALVYRAVERMNGTTGYEPAPNGSGTRFWFQLPAASNIAAKVG